AGQYSGEQYRCDARHAQHGHVAGRLGRGVEHKPERRVQFRAGGATVDDQTAPWSYFINISSVVGLRMRSPLTTSPLIRPARYRKKFQSRFRNEFRSCASELRRTLRWQWLLRHRPKQVTLPVKCFAWTAE